MHAERTVAELPAQLTHSFEERQRLNVAHHTANLGDYDVVIASVSEILYAAFDFIGDVGYNLHCFAKIVATALFVDYTFIYSSGRDIVCLRSAHVGEAFVMTEVEVCLSAVFRHITFTVLIRIERAGVNIDIGVEFLNGDA